MINSFALEASKHSVNKQFQPRILSDCPALNCLSFSAAERAPEGSAPSGLPAAEFRPPGSASAEAVEPGEDSAGPGVSAPQTGAVTAQPQATLLPQTVEAGLQEGHRVERHLGGMRGRKGKMCLGRVDS